MKNFLPENCFFKKIVIYNALNNRDFTGILNDVKLIPDSETKGRSSLKEIPGFKIQTGKSRSGNLDLAFETSPDYRTANGSLLYLLIQTRGVINFKDMILLNQDTVEKSIPANLLPPGLNQIVVFDQKGLLLSEKYVLTEEDGEDNITIVSEPGYDRREKVSLGIQVKELDIPSHDTSAISISIAESVDNLAEGIKDYMIFGSEFGIIPDDIRKMRMNGLSGAEADRFLSNLKSSWIDWDLILSGTKPALKFNSETTYHFLDGRLVAKEPSGDLEGKYVFLSVPGKKATFRYATTDMDGNFYFRLPVNDELRNLVIQPEVVDGNLNVKIEAPYSEVYTKLIVVPDTVDNKFQEMISRQAANYQVKKIYNIGESDGSQNVPVFTTGKRRFYGKPDIELVMDDYIKLPNMPEVFFELLPGVTLKGRRTEYEISIMDPFENKILGKPPILFADGVVIKDAGIIANLDPEIVEEIDVINVRYMVGDYLFYGLLNLITRKGDFTSTFDLPDYAVRFPYRVIDPVRSFSSPDYSDPGARQSRLPDFRNTLYWNPDVKVDREGKAAVEFWTSDYATDYVINIQSVTRDGRLLSCRKTIRIK
jgi:hypothetical protein